MINTILVDDEPKALSLLKKMLRSSCPFLKVIGTADSVDSAYTLITTHKPDLVFLDIAMPQESGFDLLHRLPIIDFEIIFVTGFDEYAIEAIKFCAIGYIVKPIREADLMQAIDYARDRINEKKGYYQYKQLLHNILHPGNKHNRIALPTSSGLEFVPIDDILHCEGLQGCSKVILKDRKNIVSSYNIGVFKKMLEPYGFYSPHKSHLVNKSQIKRYDREGLIEMSDGTHIPVSRRKRQEFLEQVTRS